MTLVASGLKWLINVCKVGMESVLFEVGNSYSAAGPTNFGIQNVSGTT